MMPEEDDNIGKMINMEEEQTTLNIDYSHISKHPYINKVFCWIQSGNTEEVKKFFDTFPHLLRNFNSPNKWNPSLYAARYGNIQLIQYFADKKMQHSSNGILNSYSIVHTAVYSGEAAVLETVLKNFDASVNPIQCETSPLKIAMKANNPRMVQLLAAKGAYYVFGDVFNNLYQRQNIEEQNKYWSLQTNKQIPQSMVVEQNIVRDCPIKETLKYARVKSVVGMRLIAQKSARDERISNQFKNLSNILCKDEYYVMLLRMAINKGESFNPTKVSLPPPQINEQMI